MADNVLILGGGLAGGAAAVLLARAGHEVDLLEREQGPHDKVCGEFLSVEASSDLRRLGIDPHRLGAVGIDRVRLVWKHREVEAALPFPAQGISRRILDAAVLEKAAGYGARIEHGVRVTGIEAPEVATSAGPRTGRTILLATGKHDLRGAGRPAATHADGYVGFKMHWRASERLRDRLAGFIELVVIDGGYAGIQLVAPDVANLCLIVRKTHLAQAGGGWDGLLGELMRVPGLARRLGDARPLFARPLTVANLPYGFVSSPEWSERHGIYRLGDQAAMTASLTGDGMAAALRSAFLAAECLAAGESAATCQARFQRLVSAQIRRAMMLQRATEARASLIHAGFTVLRLFPGLLGTLAGLTRLPPVPDVQSRF